MSFLPFISALSLIFGCLGFALGCWAMIQLDWCYDKIGDLSRRCSELEATHRHALTDAHLKLSLDGDAFCVLLGPNLQVGTAGFGRTLADAIGQFDVNYLNDPEAEA